VIKITESWATPQITDSELSINGYMLFRVDRQGEEVTRRGGVMLYVKECFSPVEFRPRSEFPEHVWCRVLDDWGQELLVRVCDDEAVIV